MCSKNAMYICVRNVDYVLSKKKEGSVYFFNVSYLKPVDKLYR